MNIINSALALTATYSAAMWLWMAGGVALRRGQYSPAQLIEAERQTFHLGLCFILSAGFLGLLLR